MNYYEILKIPIFPSNMSQVDDDLVATRLSEMLEKGNCGRATFMPLNRLNVREKVEGWESGFGRGGK